MDPGPSLPSSHCWSHMNSLLRCRINIDDIINSSHQSSVIARVISDGTFPGSSLSSPELQFPVPPELCHFAGRARAGTWSPVSAGGRE